MRIILVIMLLVAVPCYGEGVINGTVTAVIDGDTFVIDGNKVIREFGIDAPEKSQRFGVAAKELATEFLLGKPVTIGIVGTDKHGRQIGLTLVGDFYFGVVMTSSGLAWRYEDFCQKKDYICNTLISKENEAKRHRLGLWTDPNPIPPWEWRKTH